MQRRPLRRLALCGALALTAAAVPAARSDATPRVRVAVNNLNNPRGVSIMNDGRSVLVSEAGRGGFGDQSRCDNIPDPETGQPTLMCLTKTGSVTQFDGTSSWRVLKGLPSIGDPSGVGTAGPADTIQLPNGELITVMQGLTLPNTPNAWQPEFAKYMAHVLDNGQPVIDMAAFEAANDPDGQGVDSDPYGAAAFRNSDTGVVVDAGGNDLVEVGRTGLHVRAVFPNRMVPNPFGPGEMPQQAVPTSVVRGPDGAYYVGELGGFPFTPGTSRIWRIAPGQPAKVWKDGFTAITGLAFGPDGSLYVSEITKRGLFPVLVAGDPNADPSGGLFRIRPNGVVSEIPVPGLILAGGVAVARDGTIYQSSCSIGIGEPGLCRGQLLAIRA